MNSHYNNNKYNNSSQDEGQIIRLLECRLSVLLVQMQWNIDYIKSKRLYEDAGQLLKYTILNEVSKLRRHKASILLSC